MGAAILMRAAPYILLAVALAVGYWKATAYKHEAENAEARIALVELNLKGSEAARQALQDQATKRGIAYDEKARQAQASDAARRRAQARLDDIIRQSPEPMAWADAPLPTGIIAILRDATGATAAAGGSDGDPARSDGAPGGAALPGRDQPRPGAVDD
jgi:hypothetical protein